MPKPLRPSCYILRIQKDWEYQLNFSYNLLVKLIEKYDTLSYTPSLLFIKYLNTAFYKVFYMFFYRLRLCEGKAVAQKNWAVFYICLIWLGVAFGVTVLKVLSNLHSLCKLIGNEGSLTTADIICWENSSYFLRNICEHIFLMLCNTLCI